MSKVAIIGAGNLGSAIAYEIAAQGIVSELIIIDILKDLAEGQAADIQQALVSKNTMKVRFGEYSDLIDSEINQLVYKLYGVTEEEKKIIEGS